MKYSRITGNIEIFFDDLTEDAKKTFLEAMGMKDEREGNYDTCPIAVVYIPYEEEDDEPEDDNLKDCDPERLEK